MKEKLFEKYFTGNLTDSEEKDLSILLDDKKTRGIFTEYLIERGSLIESLSHLTGINTNFNSSEFKNRIYSGFFSWHNISVIIIILAFIYSMVFLKIDLFSMYLNPKIATVSANVFYLHNNKKTPVIKGKKFNPKNKLFILKDGYLSIDYNDEESITFMAVEDSLISYNLKDTRNINLLKGLVLVEDLGKKDDPLKINVLNNIITCSGNKIKTGLINNNLTVETFDEKAIIAGLDNKKIIINKNDVVKYEITDDFEIIQKPGIEDNKQNKILPDQQKLKDISVSNVEINLSQVAPDLLKEQLIKYLKDLDFEKQLFLNPGFERILGDEYLLGKDSLGKNWYKMWRSEASAKTGAYGLEFEVVHGVNAGQKLATKEGETYIASVFINLIHIKEEGLEFPKWELKPQICIRAINKDWKIIVEEPLYIEELKNNEWYRIITKFEAQSEITYVKLLPLGSKKLFHFYADDFIVVPYTE